MQTDSLALCLTGVGQVTHMLYIRQNVPRQAQCLAADKEKTNLICSVISNQIFVYDSFGSAIE